MFEMGSNKRLTKKSFCFKDSWNKMDLLSDLLLAVDSILPEEDNISKHPISVLFSSSASNATSFHFQGWPVNVGDIFCLKALEKDGKENKTWTKILNIEKENDNSKARTAELVKNNYLKAYNCYHEQRRSDFSAEMMQGK